MPAAEDLDAYYESGAFDRLPAQRDVVAKESTLWDLFPARAEAQLRMIRRPSTGRWLDLGAGHGYLLDAARAAGYETAGTERSPVRRESLRRRGHEVFGDLAEAPDSWDVISLSHLLEHVPNPVAFLGHLKARLAANGDVLCEVPRSSPTLADAVDEPHVVFFGPEGIRTCMERAGFAVTTLTTAGPRPGPRPMSTVIRLLGRRVLPESWARGLNPVFRDGPGRLWLRVVATAATPEVSAARSGRT